jgi:thermostable 8-oxoguanine DNA glycosylase
MQKNLRRKAVSKFEIVPYNKVGDVSFQLTREAVRKILGEFKEFKKSKSSKKTTDDFKFCHVFYDNADKVEAVEFFEENELVYEGKNLFSMSYNELLQLVKEKKFNYKEEGPGVIIESIGIAAYTPDRRRIDSILVYRRGYYD